MSQTKTKTVEQCVRGEILNFINLILKRSPNRKEQAEARRIKKLIGG
jgi:hypothetical protein